MEWVDGCALHFHAKWKATEGVTLLREIRSMGRYRRRSRGSSPTARGKGSPAVEWNK
ncbi:hypothetical protein [Bacillus sp. mrc49]|uniref:hypothetical protein n=1 Tax=Bacillus sp. mrc49 TaxID=2054913 RepID=UPI0012FE1F5E|nr:hypothetical protein [Bacillus sp. mrc49]